MALQQYAQPAADTPLMALLAKAADRKPAALPYSGDVLPEEAYNYLATHPAVLIDVRTLPEWQFTGLPDLSRTQGKCLTISWKTYPTFAMNAAFATQIIAEDISRDTPIFFLCRSGGRSMDAAIAMAQAGYRYCFNIAGGFEGEPDANGHRGTHDGWKAAQLPWKQG